jgi:hypothetical protein
MSEYYKDKDFDESYSRLENTVSHYKKKAQRPKVKKADHKHDYIMYIGYMAVDDHKWFMKVKKCSICGKITLEEALLTRPMPGGYRLQLDTEEQIHEEFPDLDLIEVKFNGNQLVMVEE